MMSTKQGEKGDEPLEVAVIGAGLAGLAAAYSLVEGGAKVTILEKSHEAGGRAKTTIKEDFHLNLGPHALYIGGATYQFLESIDMVPKGSQPQNPQSVAIFGGEVFDLPFVPNAPITKSMLDDKESLELAQFQQKLLSTDWDDFMDLPLENWLKDNIRHPKVREVIATLVRLLTYGNNASKMSTGAVFKQAVISLQGVLYLDDGWSTMINALVKRLHESATFEFDSKIEAVLPTEDGVSITANGITRKFDATILCVPPQAAQKLVPGSITQEEMAKILPSKTACLDVCLKRLPFPNITFGLGVDEPLYYSVHSNSARLAPGDGALIHLAVYLGEETGSKHHEDRLLALLDQLQPGWREELIYKRFLPNMIASNGIPSAELNGANGIASVELTSATNVFLSGDYVGSGALLADSAVKTALESAHKILETRRHTVPVHLAMV